MVCYRMISLYVAPFFDSSFAYYAFIEKTRHHFVSSVCTLLLGNGQNGGSSKELYY